jgi:hypothetical protein
MNKKSKPKKNKKRSKVAHKEEELPAEPSAYWYDRDKNTLYHANDEAIDEIINQEGFQRIIHAHWDSRLL